MMPRVRLTGIVIVIGLGGFTFRTNPKPCQFFQSSRNSLLDGRHPQALSVLFRGIEAATPLYYTALSGL